MVNSDNTTGGFWLLRLTWDQYGMNHVCAQSKYQFILSHANSKINCYQL